MIDAPMICTMKKETEEDSIYFGPEADGRADGKNSIVVPDDERCKEGDAYGPVEGSKKGDEKQREHSKRFIPGCRSRWELHFEFIILHMICFRDPGR